MAYSRATVQSAAKDWMDSSLIPSLASWMVAEDGETDVRHAAFCVDMESVTIQYQWKALIEEPRQGRC